MAKIKHKIKLEAHKPKRSERIRHNHANFDFSTTWKSSSQQWSNQLKMILGNKDKVTYLRNGNQVDSTQIQWRNKHQECHAQKAFPPPILLILRKWKRSLPNLDLRGSNRTLWFCGRVCEVNQHWKTSRTLLGLYDSLDVGYISELSPQLRHCLIFPFYYMSMLYVISIFRYVVFILMA